MNPPELNGSSLFLDFGGRKGRPTPLTISGGGSAWIGPLGITDPTEREAFAPAAYFAKAAKARERGPREV